MCCGAGVLIVPFVAARGVIAEAPLRQSIPDARPSLTVIRLPAILARRPALRRASQALPLAGIPATNPATCSAVGVSSSVCGETISVSSWSSTSQSGFDRLSAPARSCVRHLVSEVDTPANACAADAVNVCNMKQAFVGWEVRGWGRFGCSPTPA
jgi:hypothetical protein